MNFGREREVQDLTSKAVDEMHGRCGVNFQVEGNGGPGSPRWRLRLNVQA